MNSITPCSWKMFAVLLFIALNLKWKYGLCKERFFSFLIWKSIQSIYWFNQKSDYVKQKNIFFYHAHTHTNTKQNCQNSTKVKSHYSFAFWLNVIHLHTHTHKTWPILSLQNVVLVFENEPLSFSKIQAIVCVCVHIIFRVRYQLYECFTWLFYLIMYWPLVVFISFEFSRTRNPYSSFSLFSIQKCMIWISLLSWWWWWD